MAEAENIVLHSAVIATLAHYKAKQAIRREIQARGAKVSQFTSATLSALADAWLKAHRAELIAKAIEMVRTSPELRKLY